MWPAAWVAWGHLGSRFHFQPSFSCFFWQALFQKHKHCKSTNTAFTNHSVTAHSMYRRMLVLESGLNFKWRRKMMPPTAIWCMNRRRQQYYALISLFVSSKPIKAKDQEDKQRPKVWRHIFCFLAFQRKYSPCGWLVSGKANKLHKQ